MQRADPDRFPILGYILINGVVIALTLVAWYAAKSGLLMLPTPSGAGRPGVAALLALVPICFLLATVFDVLWRALGRRRDAPASAPPAEASRASASSPAVRRDMPSREIEKV